MSDPWVEVGVTFKPQSTLSKAWVVLSSTALVVNMNPADAQKLAKLLTDAAETVRQLNENIYVVVETETPENE